MRRTLMLRVTLSLLALAAIAADDGGAPTANLRVSVHYIHGRGALEVSIKNLSSGPLTLDRSSLPWLCPTSILIVLEPYNQARLTQPLGHRDSPALRECASGTHTIAKDGEESGFVDLRLEVDDLSDVVRSAGLVLFWYWRPSGQTFSGHKGYGGFEIVRGDESSLTATGKKLRGDSQPEVRVESIVDADEPSLGLAIFNGTDRNVSIPFKELPWVSQVGLILRAAVLSPPRELDPIGRFRHVRGGAWVTLPPGGYVTGALRLSDQFADLARVLEEQDVIVFWLCRLTTIEGDQIGPTAGHLVLQRKEASSR